MADKCTAITQHLHWVLKQGYLLLEERRRISAHPSSGEWSTFSVSVRKRNTFQWKALGGWINFPKALWTTNGTTLSLWETPAAQKDPLFSSTCWRTLPAVPILLETVCKGETKWLMMVFLQNFRVITVKNTQVMFQTSFPRDTLIPGLWVWTTVIQDNLPCWILGHLIKSQVVSTHDFMVFANI